MQPNTEVLTIYYFGGGQTLNMGNGHSSSREKKPKLNRIDIFKSVNLKTSHSENKIIIMVMKENPSVQQWPFEQTLASLLPSVQVPQRNRNVSTGSRAGVALHAEAASPINNATQHLTRATAQSRALFLSFYCIGWEMLFFLGCACERPPTQKTNPLPFPTRLVRSATHGSLLHMYFVFLAFVNLRPCTQPPDIFQIKEQQQKKTKKHSQSHHTVLLRIHIQVSM